MNGSAAANGASRAAKERCFYQRSAGIKCQDEVGCHGLSTAEPTALRGESKLETGTVRNDLIQWQPRPDVSEPHFIYFVYE
jgi:hypothetical protein